jgi:hypothetical protein
VLGFDRERCHGDLRDDQGSESGLAIETGSRFGNDPCGVVSGSGISKILRENGRESANGWEIDMAIANEWVSEWETESPSAGGRGASSRIVGLATWSSNGTALVRAIETP